MSPVNWAGSVSEISPPHSFLRKNFDVFIYEKPGWPGYRDLGFATEISVTGMKILPNEHSSTATEEKKENKNIQHRVKEKSELSHF